MLFLVLWTLAVKMLQPLKLKVNKTTITSNQASVNLFSTGGLQVVPGRYDIDGVTSKCRIPAYSNNGNYTQTIYFTVVAS